MNLTKEQAAQIHDMDSYRAVTGAKRFKRTADEVAAGLSPEEALRRRLSSVSKSPDKSGEKKVRASTSRKGDITIKIRPQAGVDPEYFEHLRAKPVEIVLDNKWYGWVHTKLEHPYEGNIEKLLLQILNLGLGEIIDKIHSEDDIKDYTD